MATTEDGPEGRRDEKKNSCACCEGSAFPFRHPWPMLLSMAITVVSALFYLADMVLDCILAYNYYHASTYGQTEGSDDHSHLLARSNRFRVYFWLTLTFLLIPVILLWVGLAVVIVQRKTILPLRETIPPILPALLGLCPLYSDCWALMYKFKLLRSPHDVNETQKNIKREVQNAEVTSSELRLFEKTSEAAPQLVLQLFIMLFEPMITEDYQRKNSWDSVPTIYYFTTISSLVSVAWAVTSYESCAKESKYSKADTIAGKALLFSWHLLVVCSRVSFIILAVTYPVRTDWAFLIVPAIALGAWLFNVVTMRFLDQKVAVFSVEMILIPIELMIVELQETFLRIGNVHRIACVTYLSEYIALLLAFVLASPFDTPGTCLLPPDDVWQIGCFLAPFGFYLTGTAFMFVYHAWYEGSFEGYDPIKRFESTLDAFKHSVCIIPLPKPQKPPDVEMQGTPKLPEAEPMIQTEDSQELK